MDFDVGILKATAILILVIFGLLYTGVRYPAFIEWTICLCMIFGLSTLALGFVRMLGRDGCYSGLHGFPFLEQTYPYVSIIFLATAVGMMIFDYLRRKKAKPVVTSNSAPPS